MKKALLIVPFAPLLVAAAFGGLGHTTAEVRDIVSAVSGVDVPHELVVGPLRRYDIAIVDRDCQVHSRFTLHSIARPTIQCCEDGRQFLTFLCVIPVPHAAPSWPLPKGWLYDITEAE